jgi:hypothetical protein
MGKQMQKLWRQSSPGHKFNNKKLYTCEAEKELDTSDSDSDNEGKEEEDFPNTEP